MTMIKVGDIIEVTITGVQPYGAFALLPNNSTGLIHISEISDGFVKDVETFVHKGEHIQAKIIDIDVISGQAKLSLKALNSKSKRRERRMNFKNHRKQIKETPKGFKTLKHMLPIWIANQTKKMEEQRND